MNVTTVAPKSFFFSHSILRGLPYPSRHLTVVLLVIYPPTNLSSCDMLDQHEPWCRILLLLFLFFSFRILLLIPWTSPTSPTFCFSFLRVTIGFSKIDLVLVRFRFLLFSASSLPSLQCRHGNPVAIVLCLRRHSCASGLFRLSDFVPSRCRPVGRPSQPISIGRGVGASSTRGRALVPGQSAPGSALVPHKAPAASDESCATPCDYSSDPAGLDYCMVLLHPLQPPL